MKNTLKLFVIGAILFFAQPKIWNINAAYLPFVFHSSISKNLEDTSKRDTSKLRYPFSDNDGSIYTKQKQKSPLFLKDPSNIQQTFDYNVKTRQFEFQQKIGSLNYRNPSVMSLEEYKKYDYDNAAVNYWRQRYTSEKVNKQGSGAFNSFLNPKLNIAIEGMDRIFGTNVIDIKPQGSAELILGINISKTNNPNLAANQMKHTSFDFQEKIQMGVTGSIGDKMKLGINYNTESVFDFENQAKLGYTGKEDEIIKSIEAGNVSLPLNGTLITGAHSLFGLKTELQFGKLTVTSVISQQKGQSSVIEVKNGAQTREFKIYADEYEANRHFFVGQYFKDTYESSLSTMPLVSSGVNITRIEVWVTNKTTNFEQSRNILALIDLGEGMTNNIVGAPNLVLPSNTPIPRDEANELFKQIKDIGGQNQIREVDKITTILNQWTSYNFRSAKDYEKIENARMLKATEYTLNEKLGYISLKSALNSDEVLAVAYSYTYNGQDYSVGEFSTSAITAPKTLIVKLLKGTNFSPRLKNWELMMKNVYSINAYQINADQFRLSVMYQNDKTGTAINYIPEGKIKQKQLLQVLNLDKLNAQLDAQPDGVFDFVNKVTINQADGRIFFPVLQPFGKFLRSKIDDQIAADKYVYQELYDSTQTKAQQFAEKNKFFLQGSYTSSTSSEIMLNAWNIPQGSVVVTANGIKLTENSDYTVDYALGRVSILNQALLESNTPIRVSLENNSNFNMTNKTMLGTHLDYKFSDRFQLGGTLLHLSERPLTNKVGIGDEPISNTIWGFDGSYSTKVPILTRWIDKLPFIATKEMSTITMNGEFAQLLPGHSKTIEKGGVAFIDDFDAAKATIDLKQPAAWFLASTPQGQPDIFPEGELANSLPYGYNRGLLAWYSINSDLVRSTSATPGHLTKTEQSNHFVREVFEKDLFPDRQSLTGYPTPLQVLNLAFYPNEKGPYNYDLSKTNISAGMDNDGFLNNPISRWGGVTRKIPNNDFETANYGYIEFWLMDPFVYGKDLGAKAAMYLNLGNISEDILRDSRKSFEQGLPTTSDVKGVDTTVWGRVPVVPMLVNAFDNNVSSRNYQDVGLDGLSDLSEISFFKNYLDRAKIKYGDASPVYKKIEKDPSSDDYHFFKGSDYDRDRISILDRYKLFNGLEGNSPTNESSPESYPTSGSQLPNIEDINQDNTLSETESYFQYSVKLTKEDFVVGKNYITNVVEDNKERRDGNLTSVKWYQFKIPIFEPEASIGGIQDFKSIRFMRMFLRGCTDTTVLRFAKFELIRDEWRRYNFDITEGQEDVSIPQSNDASFEISSVNIEENGSKTPVQYVLPPGVTREVEPSNNALRQLNEQSMVLKVRDLDDGGAKAAYKNIYMDVRQYKKLKMFVHAEQIEQDLLKTGDLSIFIRMGSDFKENYYEYEIPLEVTPIPLSLTDPEKYKEAVWPINNEINIDFVDFQNVKQQRNTQMNVTGSNVRLTSPFIIINGNKRIKVMGNPNLSNVKSILIGIRNPSKNRDILFFPDDGNSKSAEVWIDELRLTDFNEQGGWAAMGRITTKFADFASVTISGNTSKPGWGSIEKRINERQKENIYQYNLTGNVELGKFLPQKYDVHIPMYVGLSESFSNPQYDPLNPDLELSTVLDGAKDAQTRNEIKKLSQDYMRRRSINFTNVKVGNPKGTEKTDLSASKFYSISNLSVSYAHNEIYASNINTTINLTQTYTGAINYNFNGTPKNVSPFKNWKILKPQAMTLLRDFNFYYSPKQVTLRTEVNRQYQEIQLRNISNPDLIILPTFRKDFLWNRSYDVKWDLSRSIRLDFVADNSSRVDEPDGRIDTREKKDTVWANFKNLGRTTEYHHRINASWQVPINKIPLLNWVNVTAKYSADYYWNASPQNPKGADGQEIILGNTIKNTSNTQLTGELNFSNLYNKIKFFRNIQQELGQKTGTPSKEEKQFNWEQANITLKAGKPYMINHQMGIEKTDIQVIDEKGSLIKGVLKTIDKNKVQFISEVNAKKVTIRATGKKVPKENPVSVVSKYFVGVLLGVKRASITYTDVRGTALPGYLPKTKFGGMSQVGTKLAPGFPFILGFQDPKLAANAALNGWITRDTMLNTPFLMTSVKTFNARTYFEPITGLRVELNLYRSLSQTTTEYWRFQSGGGFAGRNKLVEGSNYKLSINMLATAFKKIDANYNNEVYQNFIAYRQKIAWRLAAQRKSPTYNPNSPNLLINSTEIDPKAVGYPYRFGPLAQEVLIPALLAAYTGKSPDNVNLSAFPNIPQLNWKITYDGLTRYEFFKRLFKTFTINHNYSCNYMVGSFTSSTGYYSAETDAIDGLRYLLDKDKRFFLPENVIAAVSLREEFSPLINIDMTWNNSLSSKVEFKKVRDISLTITNNQMIEQNLKELVVGAGYRLSKLPLFLKLQGKSKKIDSDLNIRADFSFKDYMTVVRKVEEEINQLSDGNRNISIKFSADYALDRNLNIRFFYDQNIMAPKTSMGFPTSNTKIGFSVRFTIIQ